jgi:hypothetical protein
VRPSGRYAVVWREPGGSLVRGGLTLEPTELSLHGRSEDGSRVVRRIRYAEVAGVEVGREPAERLDDRPTLVLEQRSGERLRMGVTGAGLLFELADLLASLLGQAETLGERVVVVARLKEGTGEQVRALITDGPPFDAETSGLDRHEVLLCDDTVIFLFEGEQISEAVTQLVQHPELWKAAVHWDAYLAGRPRLAETAYSWTRPDRP